MTRFLRRDPFAYWESVLALIRAGIEGDVQQCRDGARLLLETLGPGDAGQEMQLLQEVLEASLRKRVHPRPALTTDIVIITWRQGFPYVLLGCRSDTSTAFPGFWALPGGFVNIAKGETTKEAARRELEEETGLDLEALQPVGFFDQPDRDPRERVVTMVYMIDLGTRRVRALAGDDLKRVRWFRLDRLPALAFDHTDILVGVHRRLLREAPHVLLFPTALA